MKSKVKDYQPIFFKFSRRTNIIFTLLSIVVYFLLVYLFIGKVGYDVIFFLILPAVVSSALMGMNIGLITTVLIPVATIGMNYLFGDGSTNFISKYIAGTIVNLVAAFTIGRLRDMHMKLLMETDKRLEVETDKAKHVKSVRQLETRLRSIFENASIGFYRIDITGAIIMVNPALLKMMNYPFFEIVFQQDMSGEHYPHYAVPDFRERMEKDGKIIGLESEWQRYDGSTIYIHETAWEVRDEFGEVKYYDGIISDISEMKKIEQSLKENMELLHREIAERRRTEDILLESEEKYRDLVEKAGIAIVIDDVDGNITYFNNHFLKLFGYSGNEIEEMKIEDFVHPDDIENVKNYHQRRIAGEKVPTRYEFKCVRKDDSVCNIEIDVVSLKKDGKPKGTRSYMWDITESNIAQMTARENEERFKGILDSSYVGFYRTTPDGQILMANRALLQMLKYPSFELLSKRNIEEEPVPGNNRLSFKKHIEQDGVVFGYEDEWTAYDNSKVYIRESAWLIRDDEKKPLYYEGFVEDMTELIDLKKDSENKKKEYDKLQNELKLLSSLLPICSSCKKVKDDNNHWISIQDYIAGKEDIDIGLKICPECAKELSSSLDDNTEKKTEG